MMAQLNDVYMRHQTGDEVANDVAPKGNLTESGYRADSRFAPNQWETSLQSNAVSYWLGANLDSALRIVISSEWYTVSSF